MLGFASGTVRLGVVNFGVASGIDWIGLPSDNVRFGLSSFTVALGN